MVEYTNGIPTIPTKQGASLRGRLPPPATLAHKEELKKMRMNVKWTERSTILGAN